MRFHFISVAEFPGHFSFCDKNNRATSFGNPDNVTSFVSGLHNDTENMNTIHRAYKRTQFEVRIEVQSKRIGHSASYNTV
jgi:hypothetical protein